MELQKVGEKTYKVIELEVQVMKEGSETWNATIAAITSQTWYDKHKDAINLCISNNDGMNAFNKCAKEAKVPTFGYDANSDVVAAIKDGFAGTITQYAEVQAFATLRAARNAIEGLLENWI